MDLKIIKKLIEDWLSLREIAIKTWYNKSSLFYQIKKQWLVLKWSSWRKKWFKQTEEWISRQKLLNTKHWMWWTKIYNIYYSITQRCNNIKNPFYKNYWWRWIKCEWKSFEEFYRDMWDVYNNKLEIISEIDITIERINNDWNYCKDNCTFIPRKDQLKNQQRHKSKMFTWYKLYKEKWWEMTYLQYWKSNR